MQSDQLVVKATHLWLCTCTPALPYCRFANVCTCKQVCMHTYTAIYTHCLFLRPNRAHTHTHTHTYTHIHTHTRTRTVVLMPGLRTWLRPHKRAPTRTHLHLFSSPLPQAWLEQYSQQLERLPSKGELQDGIAEVAAIAKQVRVHRWCGSCGHT
jgi:hypothetical protein